MKLDDKGRITVNRKHFRRESEIFFSRETLSAEDGEVVNAAADAKKAAKRHRCIFK